VAEVSESSSEECGAQRKRAGFENLIGPRISSRLCWSQAGMEWQEGTAFVDCSPVQIWRSFIAISRTAANVRSPNSLHCAGIPGNRS
jgi:hypothetical protein